MILFAEIPCPVTSSLSCKEKAGCVLLTYGDGDFCICPGKQSSEEAYSTIASFVAVSVNSHILEK